MPQLVFYPLDPEFVPGLDEGSEPDSGTKKQLVAGLQQAKFISEKWDSPASVTGDRYLVGDNFLSLVTFMGCAPAIELEPDQNNSASTEFCHIEFSDISAETKFIAGKDFLIARCPQCRHRHDKWDSIPASLTYRCDNCGEENHLSAYDWKNYAGCGKFFISIHGIYPQEAMPTSTLLNKLEALTNTKWNYFYIQK